MREAAKIMAARWLCERAKLIELRYLENWQIGTKASRTKGGRFLAACAGRGPVVYAWPLRGHKITNWSPFSMH